MANIPVSGRTKYVRFRSADGSLSQPLLLVVTPDNVDFEDGTTLPEHLDLYAEKIYYGDNAINLGRQENSKVGDYSAAIGEDTVASGNGSMAQGYGSQAIGDYSHAEGYKTSALAMGAHAEGSLAEASGENSLASGRDVKALGDNSIALGIGSKAAGTNAVAAGLLVEADGNNSVAIGASTIAEGDNSFVHGRFNRIDNAGNYAEIVGNGTNDNNRKDAYNLDWDGNAWFAGSIIANEGYIGRAYYDSNGNPLTNYVKDIAVKDDKMIITKGDNSSYNIDLLYNFSEQILGGITAENEIGGTIDNSEDRVILDYIYNVDETNSLVSANLFGTGQMICYAAPSNQDTLQLKLSYFLDNKEIDTTWTPIETLGLGYHTLPLFCPISDINREGQHHFIIKAKTNGGTVNYDNHSIRMVLIGLKKNNVTAENARAYTWDLHSIDKPKNKENAISYTSKSPHFAVSLNSAKIIG